LAKAAGRAKAGTGATAASHGDPPPQPAAADKKMSVQQKLAQAKTAGAAKLKGSVSHSPQSAAPIARIAAPEADATREEKTSSPVQRGAQALLDQLARKGKGGSPPTPQPGAPSAQPFRVDELKAFYVGEVRPFFDDDARVAQRHLFADESFARARFAKMVSELPENLLAVHSRLEELCEARRQYLVQGRIRAWLGAWQLAHVPLSAVLFVLLAVHIVMALRVVPWEL
jgi:hypothetical protein